MDIEKVIESLRRVVENNPFPMVPVTTFEARALLTEIDYWRARCDKAESMPMAMGDDTGYDEWQAAVAGESDKARYLETLKSQPVE